MRHLLALTLIIVLAACGHGGGTAIETVSAVPVPVPQPCVSGPRPAMPTPLRERMTADEWAALQVRQKAAWVGRQAFDLKAYGESLNAATAACPEAKAAP